MCIKMNLNITRIDGCKACVCLNNFGIRLLDSGLYDEATDVYRLAVTGIKNLVSAESCSDQKKAVDKILSVLLDVTKRYTQDFILRGKSSTFFEKQSVLIIRKIVCIDDINVPELMSTSAICPIVIDDLSSYNGSCPSILDDHRLVTAILMHNFALSYRCMATQFPEDNEGMLQGENKLLRLAWSLTESHLYENATVVQSRWDACFAYIILKALQKTMKPIEADYYDVEIHLSSFRKHIHDKSTSDNFLYRKTSRAPAA